MRKYFLILLILLSLFSTAQPFRALLGKKVTASSGQEARVNFSATNLSVPTYNAMAGNPHTAIRSVALLDITGVSTGWTISSVATGNWGAFSGGSASDNLTNTSTGMSFLTGATVNVWGSCFYSYGVDYNASNPQLRISGLNTAKTYEIKIACADGTNGFDADPTLVRAVGATSTSTTSLNGNNGATDVSTGATFTLAPDGSGIINIWINKSGVSSEYIVVNGLIIKEL